jgi:HNH endonuclease
VKGPCSIEQLRALVSMDVGSGALSWLPRPASMFPDARACKTWNTRFAGTPAFCTKSGNGYFHGSLLNTKVCAHIVVFALTHGRWPRLSIDHINGNRADNRPSNLRDVSHVQNMRNQPLSRASSTGLTGVSFDKARGKFAAHITVLGRTKHLGRYATAGEAAAARAAANEAYSFHQNHGRTA